MPAAAAHTERVLQLVRKSGWLRAGDLAGAGIPRVVLTRMTASGQLERAARGLYRLPDTSSSEHEGLVTMKRDAVAPARRTRPGRAVQTSVDNFRSDPLFPRIERAVACILAKGKVVAPVDVLVAMQILDPARLEDWRRGRLPYLERVIQGNLSRLSRLLRILRFHAHDLHLVPTPTVYVRHGKGPKQQLRFTKTRDANLEAAYALHFVWPGKRPLVAPAPAPAPAPRGPATAPGENTAPEPPIRLPP